MAKDLKKFVSPKFTQTVELGLLCRLLKRHRDTLKGLDLEVFNHQVVMKGARRTLQDFFAGPEENYPEGLVADLHRIAELGNANGLEIILQQAARLGVRLTAETGNDDQEIRQDPKHVALQVFLDHPRIFDAASDMMARTSLAEFTGRDEGVEAVMDERAKAAYEAATAMMFEQDMRSRYCRIGCYDDADELVLVITHGSAITTTPIVQNDEERVISFRAAEHAVLSYNSGTGLLKIGGVAKARRADLAELFADKVLQRSGSFKNDDAQNIYTLDPVQRTGLAFTFNHDFDPTIQRVQITEVQVDRVDADPRSGETRTFYSYLARDGRDNALARLGEMMHGMHHWLRLAAQSYRHPFSFRHRRYANEEGNPKAEAAGACNVQAPAVRGPHHDFPAPQWTAP